MYDIGQQPPYRPGTGHFTHDIYVSYRLYGWLLPTRLASPVKSKRTAFPEASWLLWQPEAAQLDQYLAD